MTKPTIDSTLTWTQQMAVAVDDTTRSALFETDKINRVARRASDTPRHVTSYWGDHVDAFLKTLYERYVHIKKDVCTQLEAMGTVHGVEVGMRAQLRSGAIWVCDSVESASSVWTPINKVWNVYDYDVRSASGVFTTAAMGGFYQGFMRFGERASAWAEANETRAIVLVPPGVWGTRFTMNCFRYVNYCIQGEIRYMEDHAGGMIWIRQQDDAHDIRIYGGGVLNANFVGNDNALAIGQGNGESQPHNITIEDITIKNCRTRQKSTGLTTVEIFGNGGGKGITLQFGAVNVYVAASVIIEDCDIGWSAEGIVGTNPPNDAVQGCRVDALVTNCRVGCFIFSNQTNFYSNCLETNSIFHNCGVRGGAAPVGDFQEDPISDHFAVICASDVVTVKGRVTIFNDQYASTDPVTLIRGVFTGCDLDVYASVYRLKDVIDHRFWDGFPGEPPKAHDPSEGNRFKVHVNVADSTGMGYLLRGHADYIPIGNDYELFWRMQDGSVTSWPGTALVDTSTVSHAANRIQITNLSNSGMRKTDNKLRIGNGTSFDYATEIALVFDPPSGSGSAQRLIDFRQGGTSRDELRMSSTGNLVIYSVGASANVFAIQPGGNLVLGNAATQCVVLGDLRLGGTTGPRIAWGTGDPEGTLSAPVGSTFHRTDGGAGTSYYVKESGTGNTGWVAK